MENLAQPLLDLIKAHQNWAIAVMFITAFGESFAFISLLFPGTTLLLSHHQLISAKETLNAGQRPYLNESLYATFKPYFDRIGAWYWGHEHNLIFYQNDLTIQAGDKPLKKGRLVGCSAYEETQDDDPFKINNPAAKFMKNMPRLALSKYKTDLQNS